MTIDCAGCCCRVGMLSYQPEKRRSDPKSPSFLLQIGIRIRYITFYSVCSIVLPAFSRNTFYGGQRCYEGRTYHPTAFGHLVTSFLSHSVLYKYPGWVVWGIPWTYEENKPRIPETIFNSMNKCEKLPYREYGSVILNDPKSHHRVRPI